MDQILRDPLWQFIGAIIGAIALLTTIILFYTQRKQKVLSYQILSNASVLSIREEVEGKVQMLYEGTQVKKVHLIVLKIHNSGNVPIRTGDYERPLTILFGEGSDILSEEIIEKVPKNLDVVFDSSDNRLIVKPLLLNSKDSITFKMLVSEFNGDLTVDSRIVGIKQVRRDDARYTPVLFIGLGMLLSLGGMVYSIVHDPRATRPLFENGQEALGFMAFVLGYFIMVFGVLNNKRFRSSFLKALRTSNKWGIKS